MPQETTVLLDQLTSLTGELRPFPGQPQMLAEIEKKKREEPGPSIRQELQNVKESFDNI